VGNYDTPPPLGASNGFVLSNGVYTTIVYSALTGGTHAAGINNADSMVGFYYLPFDAYPNAFKVIGGTITGIELPDERYAQAWGINSLGQIVGFYEDRNFNQHGFLLDGSTFTKLDNPLGVTTSANGINDKGDIVGYYLGPNGDRGFLLSGGTYTTISVPDSVDTYATGINRFVGADAFHGFIATAAREPASPILLASGVVIVLAAGPLARGRASGGRPANHALDGSVRYLQNQSHSGDSGRLRMRHGEQMARAFDRYFDVVKP
jgi:probable HAF family extracellular repeat protein